MRLMRPGSCVGPQQHFLYENQMTWVRWAAVDAHKASLPQVLVVSPPIVTVPIESINLESSRRPITPPNEIDLQRTHQSQARSSRHTTPIHSLDQPPRTPGRTVQVPGQPRKTPGKSKHSVASPEVRDLIIEDEPLESKMLITDDMMLVQEEDEGEGEDDGPRTPTASTSNLAQPKFSGGVNASNLTSPTKSKPTTSTIAIGSTISNTNTTSRPTRIASRSRTTRPLSAITDNRMVDRIGTTRSSTTDFKGSSKNAVKDLVTVFESNSRNSSTEVEVNVSGGRYDLRGGRTSPSELPSPSSTTTTTIINGMGQASPSRLPQRIPAKRRGAAGGIDSTTVVGGKSCAMEMNSVGLGGVGRSVRRRRSSLGSTDFVVPGPGEL